MARLRQSTRNKREIRSPAATPQAPPKQDKTLPSTGGSDESAHSIAQKVRARSRASQAHDTKTSTPLRSRTPTATLVTIPIEHVTPNSIPLDAVEGGRVQAILVVTKMMEDQLSAEDFADYEVMITTLIRRGAKEIAVRRRYHPALIKFFRKHPHARPVHDEFAKVYNKQFEGLHERFHLPVYGESYDVHAELEREFNTPEQTLGKRKRSERNKAKQKGIVNTSTAGLPFQMDGAMDVDPSDQSYDPDPGTSTPGETPQSSPTSQYGGPGDVQAATLSEDTEMMDTDQAATLSVDPEMMDADQAVASSEVKADNFGTTPRSEGFQELDEYEVQTENAADSSIAQHATSPGRTNAAHVAIPEPSEDVRSVTTVPITPAPDCGDPEEPSAPQVDAEMIDSVAELLEEGPEGHVENDSGRLVAALPTLPPKPHFSQADSVRSYLAWLHHRQTRFPTVRPKYAECILIAKQLGRGPAQVLDEALYHWGFETGNARSEWHKQNRLKVLGEDPRFDEGTMGRWEAWLKKERDERNER